MFYPEGEFDIGDNNAANICTSTGARAKSAVFSIKWKAAPCEAAVCFN